MPLSSVEDSLLLLLLYSLASIAASKDVSSFNREVRDSDICGQI